MQRWHPESYSVFKANLQPYALLPNKHLQYHDQIISQVI